MVETQDDGKAGFAEGINVFKILQVLLRRKLLIIVTTAVTAVLSSAYSLTLPNIYAATAKVLPPQKEGAGLTSILGQMGGVAGFAAGAAKGGENDLYLGLLKSRSVGAAVIQRLDLYKRYNTRDFNQAWRRLDGSVKVQSGRDGIITVTAEDTDPKQAALLANTMVDELGRTMVKLNLSKVGAEKLFLENRLEVVRKDLKAAEDDLKRYSERNGIVKVDSQAEASVSSVVRMKGELLTKETQLAALRTSQSDESFEVKELQAAIKRLKQSLAGVAGNGGGKGLPSLGDVPGLGLDYSRKLREMKTQEALFEQLTKQYEIAKLNQAKDSSSLQVLDEAFPPDQKSRPKRSSMVVMAATAAFVASIILALLLEYLEWMPDEQRQALSELKRQAVTFP